MSRRPPCRFYTLPGGCRRGNSCNFSHIGNISTADEDPSLTSSSSTSHRDGGRASVSIADAPGGRQMPNGTCRFYWNTGDCKMGFGCRYRHDRNPDAQTGTASGVAAIAPFLSQRGLARLSDSGTDALFTHNTKPRSPNEVHNLLKRFLNDGYAFRNAPDVHAFLSLLADANTNNPAWTAEDGQLLLSAMAKDNGLRRVNDILSWGKISSRSAFDKSVLSFQRGYIPLFQYLSSDFVVKSILSHLVNALYMLLMEHFDSVAEKVTECMEESVFVTKSFGEARFAPTIGGSQVFGCLTVVLLQCLTRVKNATIKYPRIATLVADLQRWLDAWIDDICSSSPSFADPATSTNPQTRQQNCQHLRTKTEQLLTIVHRERNKGKAPEQPTRGRPGDSSLEGTLAALHNSYVGPGELRREGPRHDNDHADIRDVMIAPTHDELTCRLPPFLPGNLHGAPHHLPAESMDRVADICFRLLREELIAPLRTSIQNVLEDMGNTSRSTQLNELLKRGGGKYKGQSDNQDTVLFNIYTGAEFRAINPDRKGLSVGISVNTPPGRARAPDANRRVSFWEGMSGKRLLSGGLVALVWQTETSTDVHLGTISSSIKDHVTSARQSPDRIALRVSFFEPKVELAILQELRRPHQERMGVKLLIEATVMFASVKPFLEALCNEPTSVPFSRYLVHLPPGALSQTAVDPPAYARPQDFTYQLGSLFPDSEDLEHLELDVKDETSVRTAREELRNRSILDASQADAIVDALIHEVALIQGPPGTGKSYTGVQLLRVLLANGIGPVLMIAFTNHALDHMLTSVLDANITQKVVRLGSRSAVERIQKFSIEAMEEVAGRSRLHRAFASNHREVKDIENKITELMKQFTNADIDTDDLMRHLQVEAPVFYEDFINPPSWIHLLYKAQCESQDGTTFTRVGKGGRDEKPDHSVYSYWLSGEDLQFLNLAHNPVSPAVHPVHPQLSAPQENMFAVLAETTDEQENAARSSNASSVGSIDEELLDDPDFDEELPPEEAWMLVVESQEEIVEAEDVDVAATSPVSVPVQAPTVAACPSVPSAPSAETSITQLRPSDFEDLNAFFSHCGYSTIPLPPSSNRSLPILHDVESVWDLSMAERTCLHDHWTQTVRVSIQEASIHEYEDLRRKYLSAQTKEREGRDAARCELLRNVDIIGCTTTGAANLTAFLKTIGPRVMLVEEAGQVLEAHTLAALVPSIQQMILIGDPQQLRPTLNNFSLSMDHKIGSKIYRFDMSLMERLSSSGFPMSQIDVQRRMRPSISNLIRTTLYPRLEDHDIVKNFPAVQGMGRNIFFMDHKHKENGSDDDSISKHNQFEVDIISDLVMYLLRQGPYSGEGDIVVLCAYLGQLARMRDALSNKIAVVIDERDQRELADREAEREDMTAQPVIEHVKVLLRTIDNFQGEEAKIVILSLVRNSGGSTDDNAVYGHSTTVRANVGFLKSDNRINVALSRAREGMYIFGNARDLSLNSRMWKDVIAQLEEQSCVGSTFPIVCYRHLDVVHEISRPGEIPRISPDGGCLRQCDTRLPCGHLCPFKCHSDDPNHVTVKCEQPCTRLCPRGHPCLRSCADVCGACPTPVAGVTLPCGHAKDLVSCAAMDDLSQVVCNVEVMKQLPTCEHEFMMRCSDEPSTFICRAMCNEILSCCGKNCQAQCSRCQRETRNIGNGTVRTDNNGEEIPQRVIRTRHSSHPCQRRLYCEHQCAVPCSSDHACTTICNEPCRQICPHARCRQPCSTPCAPCQQPCTWNCLHFTCPVPCGSICARLPCDARCEMTLRCGHRCPSVCGENCLDQVCPVCADPDQKGRIVDVILQRNLEDIDPDLETLDELLITIPACGHVFTVETLDGHCNMTDYYRKEEADGKWVGLENPPAGFRKPPTCPTCRASITSPRYGRVFKRADLDILENNVAFSMSQSLSAILERTERLSFGALESELRSSASKSTLSIAKPPRGLGMKPRQHNQRALIQQVRVTPLSISALNPAAADLHLIPLAEAEEWNKLLRALMQCYRDAADVASRRSAHTHAWDASFSYLYREERELALRDPEHAPRNPHEHAMRVATLMVGQPRPQADSRFLVEAFWTTINIRLTLTSLTQAWLKALSSRARYPLESKRRWQFYIIFLFKSCHRDAQIALEIAQKSGSRRQVVKTTLLVLRIGLEQFQFNIEVARAGDKFHEVREEAGECAKAKTEEAKILVQSTEDEHFRIPRHNPADERKWFSENFSRHAQTIIDEWEKITRSLTMDTFYERLSLNEMQDIVKGLNFSHTGHFYKCPQGHTFVIADCGGANQRSFCPECGAAIGGENHQLAAGNSRAMEFEEVARQQGAQRSPWEWGV